MLASNEYFCKKRNKKCIKKRKTPLAMHFRVHFYEKTDHALSDIKKRDRPTSQQFVRYFAFQLTKCKRKADSGNNRSQRVRRQQHASAPTVVPVRLSPRGQPPGKDIYTFHGNTVSDSFLGFCFMIIRILPIIVHMNGMHYGSTGENAQWVKNAKKV